MVFKTDYRLMQVISFAECSREHSAILSTFIKLSLPVIKTVIKTFVLSIFELPFYTSLAVCKVQNNLIYLL